MAITTAEFVAAVKHRVTIPASQALLSEDDILAFASQIQKTKIVPMLVAIREEFFVVREEEDVVQNQNEYAIPYRSIGRGLRDLKIKDSQGDRTHDLTQYAIEDLQDISGYSGYVRRGFYFRGDKIVLVPTPDISTLILEKWYMRRPSAPVPVADAAQVVSISSPNVVVNLVPTGWNSGTVIDFIAGLQGNNILQMDSEITNVSGTTITFATTDDVPANLSVGDWISVAQTTPVFQLPDEVTDLLVTLTAVRVLQAIGDFEGKQILEEEAKQEEKDLKNMLTPRTEGENKKIVNRNGLLRRSRYNFRRGYWG